MTSARTSTQQTLGDWGITRVGDIQKFAGDLVSSFCLQCKFSHFKPGMAQTVFRGNAVALYQALSPVYAKDSNPLNSTADPGNPVLVTGNDFDQVREKIWAGYAQFTWKGDLVGRPAGIVAGVRYEHTEVNSLGIVAEPTAIEWQSDNDFRKLVGTNMITIGRTGQYNNLLPSVDFQIEPMHNVKARVSYSRTLARADYANLFVSETANAPNRPTAIGGVPTGTSGNPGLLPLVSDNFDISLEWYFARSSYIAAGFFAKRVKNFVGVGQFTRPLFGLRDPELGRCRLAVGSRQDRPAGHRRRHHRRQSVHDDGPDHPDRQRRRRHRPVQRQLHRRPPQPGLRRLDHPAGRHPGQRRRSPVPVLGGAADQQPHRQHQRLRAFGPVFLRQYRPRRRRRPSPR